MGQQNNKDVMLPCKISDITEVRCDTERCIVRFRPNLSFNCSRSKYPKLYDDFVSGYYLNSHRGVARATMPWDDDSKQRTNDKKHKRALASQYVNGAKVSSISCHGSSCDIKYEKRGGVDTIKTVRRSKIDGSNKKL